MHSSDLQIVAIDLAERSYHIAIRGSLFDNPLSYAELPAAHSALIVTNTTVWPLYAERRHHATGAVMISANDINRGKT